MWTNNDVYNALSDSARRLHESHLSTGRPFACPGDVLFVRSNNKYTSKANIQYQKLRRNKIDSDKFRFTHVGIVTSIGVVAHSLPHKGQLLKKILGSEFQAYGFGKSGVTLDSLYSSGFVNKENEDFLVLRNPDIFNNPELQAKITQSALYYFGVAYNFSIDLKKYRYSDEYDRYMLHCSEFVERVLVETKVKNACMEASNILPVDNYVDLMNSDCWKDVTKEYKSESFYKCDESSVELNMKLQVVQTISYIEQANMIAKLSSIMNNLESRLSDIGRKPELYKDEIEEFLQLYSHPLLSDFLKSIYRILTKISKPIHKNHIADEVLESFFYKSDVFNINFGKEILVDVLSSVYVWYMEAITVSNLVSKEDVESKDTIFALFRSMNMRAKTIFVKMDTKEYIHDGLKSAKLFARLGNSKQKKNPGSGFFALTLSVLAQSIVRIKILSMFDVDKVPYASVIQFFEEHLPKETLINEARDILVFSCADLSSINGSKTEKLVLNFSLLLGEE